MGVCLFCGAEGKLSREHVFPGWLNQLFPDLNEVDYLRAFQRSGDHEQEHVRPGKPFDQTVKRFCEACNTGWMSRLEEEAKPILAALIQDERGTLDALAQDTAARWATKTLLTAGATNLEGELVTSAENYRWFGNNQRPLPCSLVWLGRYQGEGQWPVSFHLHGMVIADATGPAPPPNAQTNSFHAIFAVGHLAMCVFMADVPGGPVATGGSDKTRTLIWPLSGGGVSWPPPTSFHADTDLRAESRRTPGGMA